MLQEALSKGLLAWFPDGSTMKVTLTAGEHSHRHATFRERAGWHGLTLDQRLKLEIEGIQRMGGRVLKFGDVRVLGSALEFMKPGWDTVGSRLQRAGERLKLGVDLPVVSAALYTWDTERIVYLGSPSKAPGDEGFIMIDGRDTPTTARRRSG